MKRIFLTAIGLVASALAQDVVSARAGMIQHIEGDVKLDGKTVTMPTRERMFALLPEVKKGSTLNTAEGRAEILLTPGVTLRLGEESAMSMIDSDLANAKVEVKEGTAIVDVLEILKDTQVTVVVNGSTIEFRKPGVFKIHASGNPELLVYEGQAAITAAGQTKVAKKGNALSLANVTVARKFDTEKGDALLRWSMRRSGTMAMANVSAASAARANGFSGGGRGTGGWYWNPYYMMYTYLPFHGATCFNFSFYGGGYCYYSPYQVHQAFYAPPSYSGFSNSGGAEQQSMVNRGTSYGYNSNVGYTVASGDRSYSGISAGASASAGAPAAAAAPVADSGGGRSGADAGGRGGEGGGRAQ